MAAANGGASTGAPAIVEEDRATSFGGLVEQAHTLASQFAELGVRAGDRVALVLPKTTEARPTVPGRCLLMCCPTAYMLPDRIAFVDTIPKGNRGKIDYAALRAIVEERKMEIKAEVREYIDATFLTGGNGVSVDDATPLITGGLIDSVGMLGLVRFLERRFGIELLPKEVDADRLDTVDAIAQLIRRKLETAPR